VWAVTPEAFRHIEAILMVAEMPVPVNILAQVLEESVNDVRVGLQELARSYRTQKRGFCLREVAGGWRFYSDPGSAAYVERFVVTNENPRLSKAAVEVLSIVAYCQPVSRGQIGEIRGVNSDGVVRSLVLRGLLEPVGADEGPGRARLYGTSFLFLERLGLRSIADLPPLADYTPDSGTAAAYDSALSSARTDAIDTPEIAERIRRKIAEAAADAQVEVPASSDPKRISPEV